MILVKNLVLLHFDFSRSIRLKGVFCDILDTKNFSRLQKR